MIGASKILTVSYGTFSCTLEGFDEPFNTMKAIAEYFRDLAAEDRYFGAEPPTPDAAMLHKIAEREIQRRVEAKIDENGVTLRAGDIVAPAVATRQVAPPLPPTVSATAAPTEASESVAARLSRLRAAQVGPAETVIDYTADAALPVYDASEDLGYTEDLPQAYEEAAFLETPPQADTVGLTEILDAAEVDLPPVAAEPEAITEPEAGAEPEAIAEPAAQAAPVAELDLSALLQAADALPEAEADPSDDLPEAASAFDDNGFDDNGFDDRGFDDRGFDDSMLSAVGALIAEDDAVQAAPVLLTEPAAATPDPAPAPMLDYIPEPKPLPEAVQEAKARARVIRIRRAEPVVAAAPVAAAPAVTAPVAAAVTAAPAPKSLLSPEAEAALQAELRALEAELGLDLSDDLADPVADLAPNPAVADAAELAGNVDDFDDFDDLDAALTAPRSDARRPTFLDDLDDEDEAEVAIETATAIEAVVKDEDDSAAQIAAAMAGDVTAAPAGNVQTPDSDAPSPVRPVRPIRPQRALRAASADAAAAAAVAANEPSEDDIMAAISALLDTSSVAAERPATDVTPAHDKLRSMLETKAGEDAISRILAQTNTEMAGAENRRRISAIQHLKAAVAATHADRAVKATGKSEPAPNPQAPYRNDLVSVTRPARSDSRPAGERPSPLVLVSELRIDRPKPQPVAQPQSAPAPRVVMPNRPRRLGAASMAARAEDSIFGMDDEDDVLLPGEGGANMFDAENSFADFAESLGATSLQDLLEASAVYCGEVLGREYFSRLQVIEQLESVQTAPERNRDDELRAFGTLMRQGRIVKVKRGQFAITSQSPLLAEAKRKA